MKKLKLYLYPFMAACLLVSMQACKSKKLLTKPAAQTETEAPPVAQPSGPAPAAPAAPAPVVKPDFNFSNVQFDFNSSVLRTDAIQYLDHVAAEMKKDPAASFRLNGHASSEGTAAHNLALSADRANAVKQYLANAGVDASRLTTQGFGATKPIASNRTEAGREKNRHVEVKLIP